ncbi:thioesterase II family protein [Streptomyces millisiae]|uniref:Alpha/beta fold hydrolase n=1 Tax=Streptomyces millisiae TaxID=3075542 RepID=A0ABU2LQJ1_9ACTN|nr:alpha/beta fold hydrolase [Streptomyces sp. DSM 44918]MDT0319775.1 alpha/beta fold hydrolase [Streptomyces sp. DSM 44918]
MTAPAATTRWVRRFHPSPQAPLILACFPHAGGSASYFFPLSRALAPAYDVLGIQYPGRQDRRHEPCVDSMAELADQSAEALRPCLDRPVVLFGHSLGATLAFEVALRLEESGTGPLGVIVSGRRAPSRQPREFVHRRDDDQVLAELRRLDGTATQVLGEDELLRSLLPAIRADYTAVETYRHRPGTALNCPVTAMTGADDPLAPVDDVRAWQDHTTGPCAVHTFPGGHFYLTTQAAAVTRTLTETATAWLAGTTPATAPRGGPA